MQQPTHQDINALGSLFGARRFSEAAEQAKALTRRFPRHVFGWKVLWTALVQLGRLDDAVATMRQAAAQFPGDAEIPGGQGGILMMLGRHAEAEASFRRALEIRPDFVDVEYNLGLALIGMGRLRDAETSFRRVVAISPAMAEAHGNLGVVLQDLGRSQEAVECFRQALRLKPDVAEMHGNLGHSLHVLGQLDEALESFRRATALAPDSALAYNKMGNTLRDLGRQPEAMASFLRAIELKPDFFDARFNLASIDKAKEGNANFAALVACDEALRKGEIQLSPQDAEYLHYALGKYHADLGEHEKSFPHYLEGARQHRVVHAGYRPDDMAAVFADVKKSFDADTMARLAGGGVPSDVPIFILGMPRSGTTLVEQILSSHPQVFGAGELPDLAEIVMQDVEGTGFSGNVGELDRERLAAWGAEYVERLRRRSPDSLRITDKLPGNFLRVGLIRLILPQAKIIHVMRNPVDTCLSCFTNRFREGQEFSYDLADLGRYYVEYHQLMQHWRDVIPDAFLDIQYEDVVADLEGQSRRLIEYCGLEWDDACLSFHENRRAVQTASVLQVRRPIYKSSVERWRRYEPFLGPLFDALGDLAPRG